MLGKAIAVVVLVFSVDIDRCECGSGCDCDEITNGYPQSIYRRQRREFL